MASHLEGALLHLFTFPSTEHAVREAVSLPVWGLGVEPARGHAVRLSEHSMTGSTHTYSAVSIMLYITHHVLIYGRLWISGCGGEETTQLDCRVRLLTNTKHKGSALAPPPGRLSRGSAGKPGGGEGTSTSSRGFI